VIVQEAGEIFQGIHKQLYDTIKKQVNNGTTLLNHRKAIMKLRDDFKVMKSSQLKMESKIESIDKFVQTLPTKEDLRLHAKAMDKALAKIQEVSTGLPVHLEKYKMSGSTTHAPNSVQVGPSYTHPSRRPQIGEENEYLESEVSSQDHSLFSV